MDTKYIIAGSLTNYTGGAIIPTQIFYDTGKYEVDQHGALVTLPFNSGIEQIPQASDSEIRGLGDIVGTIATPIARFLKLSCIDPNTNQLRPESPCAKRKKALNDIMPFMMSQ